MLKKFIKRAFISFYKDDRFYFLLEIVRNKKIIYREKSEFKKKEEVEKKIYEIIEDYPQYFISTLLNDFNQGIIPNCDKKFFLEKEINTKNIKLVCVKNYGFFTYENKLLELQKKFDFEIDFIYPIFAPIDFYAPNKNNYFYVLILNTIVAIIGYHNNLPIYFNLQPLEHPSSKSIKKYQTIEILKTSLKDYYNNYSTDFIEKIVILDTININKNIQKIIENELLIFTKIVKFNLLEVINKMSMENV